MRLRSSIAMSQKQIDDMSILKTGIYGVGLVVVDGLAAWFSVGMASFIVPTSTSIGGGLIGQAAYNFGTTK
jgi:hypothetical protein